MAGRNRRRPNTANPSTYGEQSTNQMSSNNSTTPNANPNSSITRGRMMGAPISVNSNRVNRQATFNSIQSIIGFDKAMAEISGKLDAMKVSNDSGENQSLSATTDSDAGSSQLNRQGPGLRRKKTQWKKLDWTAQQNTRVSKEGKALAGLKLPRPATAFLPFPLLPVELRLKIWGNACYYPRFIEIEYGPKVRNGFDLGSVICAGDHYRRRVSPRSRQTPALFQVSREARNEAMKIYRLRTFDTMTPNHTERYIYYNPQCDIIYFGENTCISNILNTFAEIPRDPIPRVAITASSRLLQCCDWDDGTYGVDNGISVMQALHGIFPPLVRENDLDRWPGCNGLKEVFWVVQSNLWRLAPGSIDMSVGMRPATTNGLTKGQRGFKKDTLWSMKCVEDGAWCSGKNLWTDSKPKFQFISFAPLTKFGNNTRYDGLGVNTSAVNFLRRKNWEAVKDIERSTGCVLTITNQSYPSEDPREIGFMGQKESIAAAKKLVLEKLANYEQAVVTKVADAFEDEWLQIRLVRPGEL